MLEAAYLGHLQEVGVLAENLKVLLAYRILRQASFSQYLLQVALNERLICLTLFKVDLLHLKVVISGTGKLWKAACNGSPLVVLVEHLESSAEKPEGRRLLHVTDLLRLKDFSQLIVEVRGLEKQK